MQEVVAELTRLYIIYKKKLILNSDGGKDEMLDIKRIRDDFDNVKKAVESRGQGDFGIDKVLNTIRKDVRCWLKWNR